MSSDLLAEFDSFYSAPQEKTSTGISASNDLLFLNDVVGDGKSGDSHKPGSRQGSKGAPLGDSAGYGQMGSSQHWNSTVAQNGNRPLSANYSWSGGKSSGSAQLQSFGNNSTAALSDTGGFQQPQKTSSQINDIWGGMTSFQSAPKSQVSMLQDDIWGSFNESPIIETKSTIHSQVSEKPGILRRPTLDLFSPSIAHVTKPLNSEAVEANRQTNPPQPLSSTTKVPYGEVLFDADNMAEDDEDDDEFGEFESVTPEPPLQPRPLPVSNDLSSMFGATSLQDRHNKKPNDLLSTATTLPYPQAPRSPSFRERNPFAELNLSTIPAATATTTKNDSPKSETPVTAWPTYEPRVAKPSPYVDSPAPNHQADDEWGDFADLPPETPIPKVDSGLEGSWGWDAVEVRDTKPEPAVEVDLPPPTNIPPPSVLLALFPSLFDLPQSALFKPVANQSFPLKNRIISDPSTIDFLRAYLFLACVAAHITAGRKLRWKRDTFLSQAMSIGPAAAGGKGGMKLAGIDKTEVTKEDREAAEVVRTWKDQLGRLRSAVAVANSSLQDSSKHLAIPDVSEGMHIKTQVGAVTAPKPCLVCGLKREERVNKVDIDVEDSFGEWWVEHWGHRLCRNFWLEHQTKLNQR